VVFGKSDGTAVDLSALGADEGFRITGASTLDNSGYSVSAAGDVNGDGLADLILGANGADPNGNVDAGAGYVVFGKTGGETVDLSALGTGGFAINGAAERDAAGYSVSGAGDVNGDGFADLIVGANKAGPNGDFSGASYVVFGKPGDTAVELSALGAGGFEIRGAAADDEAGNSVSAAGDVNGDGLADLIVGANLADPDGRNTAGASYVVFGKTDDTTVELSAIADGTGGFTIIGAAAGDSSGWSVSGAGDVNGDGFDDLIVGAPNADLNGDRSGTSYVVFGKSDGAAVDLSALGAADGFLIVGAAADDGAGHSVRAAGDVNGDGFADLIVGAPAADPFGRSDAGAGYVVFGGDFTGSVMQIGTDGADSPTGTADAEGLVGGAGDDTLAGSGGADVLYGGAGDDVIAVSELGFRRIDGGTGTDTLRLEGTGLTLDLVASDLPIRSIERIDLAGGGNTLRVSALEVQRLTDHRHLEAGETADGNLTLRVTGEIADRVQLSDAGWTAAGQLVDAGRTFNIHENGRARIEIADGVAIETLSGGAALLSLMAGEEDAEAEMADLVLSGTSGADVHAVHDVAGVVSIIDFRPEQGDVIDLAAFGFTDFAAVMDIVSSDGATDAGSRLALDGDTELVIAGFAPALLDDGQFHLPVV